MKEIINENNIIYYNKLYYSLTNKERKEDFIDELKNPKILNIEPYILNNEFIDLLGTEKLKKKLGSYFTPNEYVKLSTELLRQQIPSNKDYLIIDRCAGTGNLEKYLTDEELKHCILNTLNYTEWDILKKIYLNKVLKIYPETDLSKDNYGNLEEGNALLDNFFLKEEIKDFKGKIILLENPPYSSGVGIDKNHKIKEKIIYSSNKIKGNDLSTKFIYSGINLLKENDSYILFSPPKYYQKQDLTNDLFFVEGYILNQKHFHGTEKQGVFLCSWIKKYNSPQKHSLLVKCRDIFNSNLKIDKSIYINKYNKKQNSLLKDLENNNEKQIASFKSTGYINSIGQRLTIWLTNNILKNNQMGQFGTSGFKVTKSNLKYISPLFSVVGYLSEKCRKNYYTYGIINACGDGGIKYKEDEEFLNDCLFWTCLSNKNKCHSTNLIRNEITLFQNTIADELIYYENKHKLLVLIFKEILEKIKHNKNYNSSYAYGIEQIEKELKIEELKVLKKELKLFYEKNIEEKLFQYKLLC